MTRLKDVVSFLFFKEEKEKIEVKMATKKTTRKPRVSVKGSKKKEILEKLKGLELSDQYKHKDLLEEIIELI